jgi:hypothetical protein
VLSSSDPGDPNIKAEIGDTLNQATGVLDTNFDVFTVRPLPLSVWCAQPHVHKASFSGLLGGNHCKLCYIP